MKYAAGRIDAKTVESLPVRGAWIEMIRTVCSCRVIRSRSPCGERGLKCSFGALDAERN